MARTSPRQRDSTPSGPAASPSRPTSSASAKSVAENIKETLESIVVAFIMAFVFRAFIVEAFVIPTGSMADTLYGAQYLNTCSTCGYQYALGAPPPVMGQQINVPLCCPNCNTQPDRIEKKDLPFPNSGDRILVHKWPFYMPGDTLGPQRWKVTVFKDPNDGVTNFIKRLVGEPGEVLQIIDGDIYTASLDILNEKAPELVAELEDLRTQVYDYRPNPAAPRAGEIRQRYAKVATELLPYLKIQQKLPDHESAQASLWFNVYDNDFLPNYDSFHIRSGTVACWKPSGDESARAWNTERREITFSSESQTPLAIAFSGKQITDFYAYNADGVGPESRQDNHPVGDLRLSFTWLPHQGSGGLILRMNRDRDQFIAHLNLDGVVRLEKRRLESGEASPAGSAEELGKETLAPFLSGRAYAIELINVDYRVSVKIDGHEVLVTTADQYEPDRDRLATIIEDRIRRSRSPEPIYSEVTIAGHAMRCALRHVKLQRDVYYRSPNIEESELPIPTAVAGRPTELNPYRNWPGWGTEGMPILLRPHRVVDGRSYGGEFFMLGDNSPASKDSRLWWQIGPHLVDLGAEYQVGTVPRDQLIGEAFFVYWPSGYRGSWFPRVGVVPNFGRMRWIR